MASITTPSTVISRLLGRKFFRMARCSTSSRTVSSVSRGMGSGCSERKICIWNQSAAFSHPAAAHSSARFSCPAVGAGLNSDASGT